MMMNGIPGSRVALLLRAAAPVLVLLGGIALLWRFPPTSYSFYPRCAIHHYFGVLCPGCGGTRALAALVHGHLREALRLNALVILLLPIALPYGAKVYARWLLRRPLQAVPIPALYAALTAVIVFAAARNL